MTHVLAQEVAYGVYPDDTAAPQMTSASLSEGIEDTQPRGWAVLLLHHLQISSLRLSSFVLSIFLPFITADLGLTPLQAGPMYPARR